MSSPKPSKTRARPCPQGCGFSLRESDDHEACPVCLGILHARRALTDPDACAVCRQLKGSSLERRVKFVERILGQAATAAQDPFLFETPDPLSSEIDMEGSSGMVVSWGDHMDEISELELAGQQLAPPLTQSEVTDDEVLDLGLDEHGFSGDEDQPDPQTQAVSPSRAATAAQDPFLFASPDPLGSGSDIEGSSGMVKDSKCYSFRIPGMVVSWGDHSDEISELELAAQQLAPPLTQSEVPSARLLPPPGTLIVRLLRPPAGLRGRPRGL